MSEAEALVCEIVTTRTGARAVRDRATGELMHPVIGPVLEAERLYVEASRLGARLREDREAPLVLLDVGLGAGSNALAAWKASEGREGKGRRLEILSFDRSTTAMELATTPEHAGGFGFVGPALDAARAVLSAGAHETSRTRWRFVPGELPASLERVEDASADVVFWDPFSPRANPSLWTVAAFSALRRCCREGATVHTYSAATSTRAAMLLAGFAVGAGDVTGLGKQTTLAAVGLAHVARPLDRRWLERLERSTAPLPVDAPQGAMERIRALPQLAR